MFFVTIGNVVLIARPPCVGIGCVTGGSLKQLNIDFSVFGSTSPILQNLQLSQVGSLFTGGNCDTLFMFFTPKKAGKITG
jgi:hypothetical protein